MKGVAQSDEATETLMFWFTVTALTVSILSVEAAVFSEKGSKNPMYTSGSTPNSRQTQVASSW